MLLASEDPVAKAELQWRIAASLAVLAFAVLAVPLARAQPRKDVYGRVVVALLVYFVFLNLMRAAERWMEMGTTPGWLGLWWVPLMMLGVAAVIQLLDSHWLTARVNRLRRKGNT